VVSYFWTPLFLSFFVGKKDGTHSDPHHDGKSASSDMLAWCNDEYSDGMSLLEAVQQFKPTVLLGLTTQGGLFTEEIVKTMHSNW
jgi:malic enzyme